MRFIRRKHRIRRTQGIILSNRPALPPGVRSDELLSRRPLKIINVKGRAKP